jgi:Ca2+-binding RTX toxin-like protein
MKQAPALFATVAAFGVLSSAAQAAAPTVQEQLMLELVNRARLDPAGEAGRFGINLNEGPPSTPLTTVARQPLAMNSALVTAAHGHSADMIARHYFEHDTPEGVTPQQRATGAGYTGQVGENIAQLGVSPGPIDPTTAIIQEHKNLFVDAGIPGRGHRLNILDNRYKEVGIGQSVGDFGGFSTSMVTQDFGIPDPTRRFLTGVAFNDTVVADKFYTVGEARVGVKVNNAATGGAAGGYVLSISTAAQNIVFSAGGLANPITVAIKAGADNIKLDVVNGNTIFSSTSVTHIGGAKAITLLGVANINATGAGVAEVITGNRGPNNLTGNGAPDTLRGGPGNDILNGGPGADTIDGGPGRDTLTGGPDADKFHFNAVAESGLTDATRDVIADFVHSLNVNLADKIDVSAIDASSILPDNNAFEWRGTGAFTTSSAGQLRFQKFDNPDTANDFTIVSGDTDADVASEFEIKLQGLINLASTDFTP